MITGLATINNNVQLTCRVLCQAYDSTAGSHQQVFDLAQLSVGKKNGNLQDLYEKFKDRFMEVKGELNLWRLLRVYLLIGYLLFEHELTNKLKAAVPSKEEDDDEEEDEAEILFAFGFATNNLEFSAADFSPEVRRMFAETQRMHFLLSSLGWQDKFVA